MKINKFLLTIVLSISVYSVYAQEIHTAKMSIEPAQFEYSSQALLKVTPTIPEPFTSHNEVSFKISNVGSVNVSSSILHVNIVAPDDKLIWEGVKTFGNLKPAEEVIAKFDISLKEIKSGMYKLRYILIYANKEIDERIDIPIKISYELVSNEPEVSEEAYTIGPLDVLEIFVIEDEDLRKTVTVAPDGRISFPVIGSIYVCGMTTTELSKKIASFLAKDYIVDPHVTVSVVQISSKKFSIVGEVKKPGVFPLNEGVSLLKAIALAGGFTKFADLRKVKILREKDGEYEIIQIDVNKIIKKGQIQHNITIYPEDIIIVPESLF